MNNIKTNKPERGQSLIELALTFTFLMFLFAGAVDLGRAFFALVALNDAAQEGAVYASLHADDQSGIVQYVRTSSSDPINLADENNVHITITTFGDTCIGNSIEVNVSYDFNLIMPLIDLIVPSRELPLYASMIHTILGPVC
jgi:Flp pilus assembly protein TadG